MNTDNYLHARTISVNMSDMSKSNQDGSVGSLVVIVMLVVLVIGSLGFGFWAFSGMQKYKTQTDQIVAAAVSTAEQQTMTKDAAQAAQAAKSPLSTYNGPSQFGSLVVKYPKTYSAYVDDSGTGSSLIDGYFQPGVVPSITSYAQSNTFALRIQLLNQSYDAVLQPFTSNTTSQIVATPYSFPNEKNVVGTRIVGQIADKKVGDMIIIPLRDKTLKVWTESTQYEPDFNNFVLPNFNFSP